MLILCGALRLNPAAVLRPPSFRCHRNLLPLVVHLPRTVLQWSTQVSAQRRVPSPLTSISAPLAGKASDACCPGARRKGSKPCTPTAPGVPGDSVFRLSYTIVTRDPLLDPLFDPYGYSRAGFFGSPSLLRLPQDPWCSRGFGMKSRSVSLSRHGFQAFSVRSVSHSMQGYSRGHCAP